MSPVRAALLVARREMRERVRSRAFRASLLVQIAILVILVVISSLTGDDGPQRYDVAVAGTESQPLAQAALAAAPALDVRLTLHEEASEADARARVDEQDVDAAIAGDRVVAGPDTPDELIAVLQAGARAVHTRQELRAAGVPPDRVEAILAPQGLPVERVGPAGADEAKAIAYLGTLLLYIAILTFGYMVAAGVVEEKSSRVVELLLSAIRPRPLLAGKVLGIGMVGLAQLCVIAAAGLIAAAATGDLDLPSTTVSSLALVAVCFVLGYALYASAFAAAGAMVSRQEDLQSVTGPLVVVLVAGYIATNSAIEDASGSLAQVLTFVPPLAPLIVPARAARDALPAWQLAVSIALMIAFAGLLIAIAARIYERGVLRSGAPLKLLQGLRLARR